MHCKKDGKKENALTSSGNGAAAKYLLRLFNDKIFC